MWEEEGWWAKKEEEEGRHFSVPKWALLLFHLFRGCRADIGLMGSPRYVGMLMEKREGKKRR